MDVLGPLLQGRRLGGLLLVVAAHPDDETLGASWLLSHSPGRAVLHVTDGAPRDAGLRSPEAPPSRAAYARLRQQEALAALRLAGVAPERLFSLGAVDQEAVQALVTLTQCLLAHLKALRPALLVTHPYEGGHPDHDAAAFIAHAAVTLLERAGRTPPVLAEMTSYHLREGALVTGEFLPAPQAVLVSTVVLSEEERALKREMLACFATQARVLAQLPLAHERYRLAPRYDFTRPPHAGRLHYESLGWRVKGTHWRELARRALRELRLPGG